MATYYYETPEQKAARQARIDAIAATTDAPRLTVSGFRNWRYCPWCAAGRFKAGIKPANGVISCYLCGPHSLEDAESVLGIVAGQPVQPRSLAPAKPHAAGRQALHLWKLDPMRWHSRLISRLDIIERWQQYKPVSEENIMRYQLGAGVLPPIKQDAGGQYRYTMGCSHERLTYCNLENKDRQPRGFRGRQLACDCRADEPGDLKWLTVAGTDAWLFNAAAIEASRGANIVITENPIDGILFSQAMPDYVVCAGTAGASTWRPAWSQLIAAAQPRAVMIILDNDLIGTPNAATLDSELARWCAKWEHRKGQPATAVQIEHQRTKAMGPKIAAELRLLGVKAEAWQWPDGTPAKMDLGSYLINEGLV